MCDASSRHTNSGRAASATSPTEGGYYRVEHLGGIALHCSPSVLSPPTGAWLSQHEIIEVCEEISCPDGRVCLRLKDGRGWACGDTERMPHDPSVVRCMEEVSCSSGWLIGDWEAEVEAVTSHVTCTRWRRSQCPLTTMPPCITHAQMLPVCTRPEPCCIGWNDATRGLHHRCQQDERQLLPDSIPATSCGSGSFDESPGYALTVSTDSGGASSADPSDHDSDNCKEDQNEGDDGNECKFPDTVSDGSCPDTEYEYECVSAAPCAHFSHELPNCSSLDQPCAASVSAWYRVAYVGGVLVRSGPSVSAPATGARLAHNTFFAVADEVPSSDARVYLRLADGTGWAFDDSNIMPHDPSCVRGWWAPNVSRQRQEQSVVVPHVLSTAPLLHVQGPLSTAAKKRRRKRKSHRRGRGLGGSKAAAVGVAAEGPVGDTETSDEETVQSETLEASRCDAGCSA